VSRARHSFIRDAARLGHLSTGAVYIIVGSLTLLASVDRGVRPGGSQEALHPLSSQPLGVVVLVGIALGLVADSIWQVIRTATDADLAGRGIAGTSVRLGWAISGLVHLGLAVAVGRLVVGTPQPSSEAQAKVWTAIVLSLPFGRWLVGATGLVVIGVGVFMLHRAWIGDVDKWLDLSSMSRPARWLTLALGEFGLAARAIVYGVVGAYLLRAAVEFDARDARGLGGAFRALLARPYGAPVLAAIALGFIANGVLEIVRVRYRRIRVVSSD
jgi:uncharacterized protein DUF1206